MENFASLGNLYYVILNHPELKDEYLDVNSKFYDCPNAVKYRKFLKYK